jgi:sugar phosphate permease
MFDRVMMGVSAGPIMKDLHLTYAQYGNGMSLMLLVYGPMQAVVGFICDRYGARRILMFSIISWSATTWWMAHVQSLNEWYARQLLFGILCATEFIPSTRIVARWFSKRQRAQAHSFMNFSAMLCPALAPVIVTALMTTLGSWRPVFTIAASMGVLALVLMATWIVDRPEQKKNLSPEEISESYEDEISSGTYTLDEVRQGKIAPTKIAAQRISFGAIMRYPQWAKICIAFVVIQAMYWAAVSWIPLYLKETFGFNLMAMGWWSSVYFVGAVVAILTGAQISDRVFKGKRQPIIMISYGCAIPLLLLIATFQKGVSPAVLLTSLIVCGFFANLSWGAWYAWPSEIFSPEVVPKALGIMNGLGYIIGAAGAPLVMSRLIVKTATGVSYTWAWVFVAALPILGLLLIATVNEGKMAKAKAQMMAAAASAK